MNNNAARITGHEDCTGCAVCLLSCPVWKQTHDIMLTNAGRARALQSGATPEELKDSAAACLLCGACAPVCPVKTDTVALTLKLRAAAPPAGKPAAAGAWDFDAAGKEVFLPGPDLRREEKAFRALVGELAGRGFAIPPTDELSELAALADSGIAAPERLEKALRSLSAAAGIVAAEGSLLRHLRRWLPGVPAKSLGEELLRARRKALKPGDLYVPDARVFNSDHTRLVRFYDEIRLETGCIMSTSLQRAAMPSGPARPGENPSFNAGEQARWVLGRAEARRVIVESAADLEVFRKAAGVPVIHVSEL